jgi:SAM-dependent methyltransferase
MRRRRVDALADLQHPDSRSFELVADVYERARPEYPPDAVAWIAEELDLRPGRTVLDLGAGTGKLTRALLQTGARVVALEPGEQMLAQLQLAVPGAEALHAAAEAIPLPNESVDAATMGQSFHWFRHDEALPELHRVLRRGAGIALMWNWRDQDSPLQKRLNDLIEPFVPSGRKRGGEWLEPLDASPLFSPAEKREFRFSQRLDAQAVVDRITSISFIASAAAADRERVEEQLRTIVEGEGGEVELPYVTHAYFSRKVE